MDAGLTKYRVFHQFQLGWSPGINQTDRRQARRAARRLNTFLSLSPLIPAHSQFYSSPFFLLAHWNVPSSPLYHHHQHLSSIQQVQVEIES